LSWNPNLQGFSFQFCNINFKANSSKNISQIYTEKKIQKDPVLLGLKLTISFRKTNTGTRVFFGPMKFHHLMTKKRAVASTKELILRKKSSNSSDFKEKNG
jgi:hypothetical protein